MKLKTFLSLLLLAWSDLSLGARARKERAISDAITWNPNSAVYVLFAVDKGEYLVHSGKIKAGCRLFQGTAPIPIAKDGSFSFETSVREREGQARIDIHCSDLIDRWIFRYRWKKDSPFFGMTVVEGDGRTEGQAAVKIETKDRKTADWIEFSGWQRGIVLK